MTALDPHVAADLTAATTFPCEKRGPRCPCGTTGGDNFDRDADGEPFCPVFTDCGPCGCDGGCDRGDGCHTLAWARRVHPDLVDFDWRGRERH